MTDNVTHPPHYADGWSNGAEVIDITENLNFNRGNAVKYIARAGKKNPDTEIEDLKKARWYVERELVRLGDAESAITSALAQSRQDALQLRLDLGTESLGDAAPGGQREPRVWSSLLDVPTDVIVTDCDGDRWEFSGQLYKWEEGDGGPRFRPFTEVIE